MNEVAGPKKCWSRFTVKARGILPARNDPKNMVTARRSSHCESADILKTKEARRSKKEEGRKEDRIISPQHTWGPGVS